MGRGASLVCFVALLTETALGGGTLLGGAPGASVRRVGTHEEGTVLQRRVAAGDIGSVGHIWGMPPDEFQLGDAAEKVDGNLKLRGGLGYLGKLMVLPGHCGRLQMTPEEMSGVKQIRQELAADLLKVAKTNPEMSSDDRILRFLRSYKHDVGRTIEGMRNMLDWRNKQGTDHIRHLVVKHWNEDFWQMNCLPRRAFFRKMYLFEPNYSVDETGNLVSVECTGRIDIRGFMHGVTEHEIIRFWCFLMEWNMIKLAQLTKRHGRLARMVQIKDMDGLSPWQSTCKIGMQRFGKINWMLHLVYPETLSRLIVTNVPGVFGAIWNAFKPLLPERTVKKIQILPGAKAVRKGLATVLGEKDPLTLQGTGAFLFMDTLEQDSGTKRVVKLAAQAALGLGLTFVVGSNMLASFPKLQTAEARRDRAQKRAVKR